MSKSHIAPAVLLLLLAGSCAGCGASRPVKFYVLDSAPAPVTAPAAQYPVTLLVGHLSASHLYRDDRLVYGAGPVELGTYEYNRWAEIPTDMIQDMILTSLRASGQYRSVERISSNVRGNYIVRGHLYSLYEVDKPALLARFSLELELFDPATHMTVWSDSYSHDEPVQGKSVPEVVEALDHNVQTGIQQLIANLNQYFASHPAQP